MQVTPKALGQLRAVFGDCVPKENAAAVLEKSALAPTDPGERAALFKVLGTVAGERLPTASVAAPSSLADVARASVQARRDDAEARRLFSLVAAMKDVPFDFLEEGCVHRSHVVAKRLEEQGVECEKVFCIPRGADLVMETPKAKLGYTVVWYHEAVCVVVGGERRVLDPSVADRPLSVEEWRRTMRPAKDGVELETFFLPRFAYGLQDRDHPPSTWRDDDVKSALSWNDEWRDVEKALTDSGFYDTLPELARGIV